MVPISQIYIHDILVTFRYLIFRLFTYFPYQLLIFLIHIHNYFKLLYNCLFI